MARSDFKSVDDYIASQPAELRDALRSVRVIIRKAIPGSEETISYNMPAYKLHGRAVLYFAGWQKHFSLYPITNQVATAFKKELRPYELSGKGTARFSLSDAVPATLIERIAKFRTKEVEREARASKSAKAM